MQEITTREKLFALLGFFILLFSLPLALLVVRQRVTYRGRASLVVSVPKQVMITNVHSVGFTVSWLTDNQTSGSVLVDDVVDVSSPVELPDSISSDSYTHYVDVVRQNLDPEHDYYIKIKSGPDTYGYASISGWTKDIGTPGQGLKVRTAKQIGDETQPPSATNPYGAYSTEAAAFGPCPDGTLNADGSPHMNPACFRPYPLWGEVKIASGQLAQNVLIFAAINEVPDSSVYALSTITDQNGKWSLDLANQYTSNFTSYLAYNPLVDRIKVVALGAGFGDARNITTGLPMVSVLSTECPDPATNCPMNAPSPVILTLSGGNGGVNFVINKVQLQGRTDGTMTFTVKFRQANTANTSAVLATVNASTNASGISSTVNVPSLASGNYDVYLVPNESYLSAKLSNVSFGSTTTTLDFTNGATIGGGQLCANMNSELGKALCLGDLRGLQGSTNDNIGDLDVGTAVINYGKNRSQLSDILKQADFDNNGTVDNLDCARQVINFGKKGADAP